MLIQNQKIAFGIIFSLVLLNILAWSVVYKLNKNKFLEVTFFNVGQGDAIFIETPERHQILIDGGQSSAILEKLGKEMPFWDRTIDLIILTHPEHDHVGGLIEVLRRYKVENILWTGVLRDTAEYQEWQRLIREENAQIYIAQSGQKISGGQTSVERRSDLRILYPLESLEGEEVKNTNNTSIIIRLTFGVNSFLFTGDAYKSAERKLIDRKLDIDSDILKVGHHGSKTSSAEEFIFEVSPEIAIISAGKDNPYGHPHPETLEILEKYDIRTLSASHLRTLSASQSRTLSASHLKLFRTDIHGDIKVISNGKDYVSDIQNKN